MSGFFNNIRTEKKSNAISSYTSCGACGLHKKCTSPKMKPYGLGEKGILIIGDAPSSGEDKKGIAMGGDPAKYLANVLKRYGVDMYVDCIKINSIFCYTGYDHDGGSQYVNYCRPAVWKYINDLKPKMIILLGNNALLSFLGHRWQERLGGIKRWRGFAIPDRDSNCWVCPTFHPAFVINNSEKQPMIEKKFKEDIKQAIQHVRKNIPASVDDRKLIEVLEGKELYKRLMSVGKSELSEIAIDFETTGLKPDRKGHQIVTCAIAEDEKTCFAFKTPTDKRTLVQLFRLLENPAVRKVMANMKFECSWAKVIWGVDIQGLVWDTMQAAHILDNRGGNEKKEAGVTGLKFQVYVNFGVVDYNSGVGSFLKSKEDNKLYGANAFNNILEANMEEVLIYNGLDSLYELRLANVQRRIYHDSI